MNALYLLGLLGIGAVALGGKRSSAPKFGYTPGAAPLGKTLQVKPITITTPEGPLDVPRLPWTKLQSWTGRQLGQSDSEKLGGVLHGVFVTGNPDNVDWQRIPVQAKPGNIGTPPPFFIRRVPSPGGNVSVPMPEQLAVGYGRYKGGYSYLEALLMSAALAERITPHKYFAIVPVQLMPGGALSDEPRTMYDPLVALQPAPTGVIGWPLKWWQYSFNGINYGPRFVDYFASVLDGADLPADTTRWVPACVRYNRDVHAWEKVILGISAGIVGIVASLFVGPLSQYLSTLMAGSQATMLVSQAITYATTAIGVASQAYAGLKAEALGAQARLTLASDQLVQSALDGTYSKIE